MNILSHTGTFPCVRRQELPARTHPILDRLNVYPLSTAAGEIENDRPIGGGEQGIVFPAPDVISGMDAGSSLTDENVSGAYNFPGVLLYAQAF